MTSKLCSPFIYALYSSKQFSRCNSWSEVQGIGPEKRIKVYAPVEALRSFLHGARVGLNSVKKILLCLGEYFPNMSFCPILPSLVSLILHFSEDEAECFYSVSRLILTDTNKRYIDQTFLTSRASCVTFADLANRCCRGIRKLIASSHLNLFEFYSDWIMWIFADLRFTLCQPEWQEDFRTDVKSFVQGVARHCTAEKLLERAFQIPMATRRELNLLFYAKNDALMQKGVSTHQKR
uniref:Rab-GAP TBC domain-containing protein n=1 Tax=Nothobranchius furzeri TaxID=105023 RepID=A0A8C6M1A4_NOTFU